MSLHAREPRDLPRFSRLDVTVAASCVVLALLSFVFSKTEGLVASTDADHGPRYSRHYASTGNDDDVMVQAGTAIFGLCLLLTGWWPGRSGLAVAKAGTFTAAWLLQLLALMWIEVGSLSATVFGDLSAVLAVWLISYALSLPCAWYFTIVDQP